MREKCSAEENTGFTFSDAFPVTVPEYFNYGFHVIDKLARRSRNRLAMIWANQQGTEKRFTFHDLSNLSNQAANLLIKYGISREDRVFILLPRIPEWWIFSLALIKIGAIQCPSPILLTPHDIRQRIQFGHFKMVITDRFNADKIDEIHNDCPSLEIRMIVDGERDGWISYSREIQCPTILSRHKVKNAALPRTRSSDPMLMIFTSGTSKMPKLVLHSHGYPLGHRVTARLWHGLAENDVHFTVSDTGWAKNLWGNYFGQWITGACLFIYDIRGKFHAEELLSVLEKYEITSFCAPPTVYRMMVLHDLKMFDLRSLRHCTSAGEPLHNKTSRLWQEGTGLTIREGFGQTETVCMIGNFVGEKIKEGAMGKASPGWNISIHDDGGNPLPDGETGRIAIDLKSRPIGLLEYYVGSDEENAAGFINGFYYTGDKAWRDKDGFFWFVGRSDDVIKSSGYRIGPQEVEEVIMHHPAVQEVAEPASKPISC
ncbi:MAG: Acetyl-coenzyme A synthetase [Lentisphaerae bacterium ADurb.Bin242]|nr:MAG: Acetyl-coenzyme A synthetase [Lentisphaerae bacterium ADurb.Bin242]